MTPYELQMVTLEAHKRFYRGSRIFSIHPEFPRYRKHQLEGYLLAHAWEHVPENKAFLRELRDFSDRQSPSAPDGNRFMGPGLSSPMGPGVETPTT